MNPQGASGQRMTGRVVGGRYELGGLLGYGGMAEVYLGRDLRLGRDVAVKLLRVDLARDPSFHARFRREAQAAAMLNHPNIVAVYDTGEDTESNPPLPYLVMEYVEGRTLRELLQVERRLSPRRAMEIAAEVALALDYSHRMGIIHRDVKPGNVMVARDGAVKVMDFGIARAVDTSGATMTQTAAVMGTAQYLSPEQARGETVDSRSDIYSLGCLLYELVTGVPPFTGDNPVAVAYQHVREQPVPPSERVADIPPALDAIVLKALAKNPANRYQSGAELAADLHRALAGRRVEATPLLRPEPATTALPPVVPAAPRPAPPSPRRRRGWLWAVALLCVVALVVLGWLVAGALRSATSSVTVPNVVGKRVDAATAALSAAGLTAKEQQRAAQQAAGIVIDSSPAQGSKVATGSTVTLVVSSGPQQVTVPKVTGMTLDAATATLSKAGLQVHSTQQDGSAAAGTVLSQDPADGSTVNAGSTVNLVVASGTTTVPSVEGLTVADAQAALQTAGLKASVQSVTQAGALPGVVTNQSPAANRSVPVGTTVVLQVVSNASPSPSPSTGTSPSASPAPSASPSAAGTPKA